MLAVVFDLFETLTDPTVEAQRRSLVVRTAEPLGVDEEEFWTRVRSSFHDRITGSYGDTRATLVRLAAQCGVAPSEAQLNEALRVHLGTSAQLRAPRFGALQLLSELRRRGFKLGLVSDCSSETAEGWSCSPYAPLFDAVVMSFLEGTSKPDPRLYAAVADRLQVPPASCWYVGDGASNELIGARDAGMTPILVTNDGAGTVGDTPTINISDIREVLGVVGSPGTDELGAESSGTG